MIKWEVTYMDFVLGFLLTSLRHNSILVVVDKMAKNTHFILIKDTYNVTYVERVFINEIIRLHGVLKKIISNRNPKFTLRFCTSMESTLGT